MFKQTFSFSGRIRRTEYCISIFILIIISIFVMALNVPVVTMIYCPLTLWFIFAQGSKRSHDIGDSGWYQLIPLYVLMLMFKEGDIGANEFGEDSKERSVVENGEQQELPSINIPIKYSAVVNDEDEAEFTKAMQFYNGTNDIGEQSFSKAVVHLKNSALLGHSKAKDVLATCYYNGDGVEQSYREAIRLWKQLAKEGNSNAQYNLGLCYYLGKGVDKENDKAVLFLRSACHNLNDKACSLLNRINREITLENNN